MKIGSVIGPRYSNSLCFAAVVVIYFGAVVFIISRVEHLICPGNSRLQPVPQGTAIFGNLVCRRDLRDKEHEWSAMISSSCPRKLRTVARIDPVHAFNIE